MCGWANENNQGMTHNVVKRLACVFVVYVCVCVCKCVCVVVRLCSQIYANQRSASVLTLNSWGTVCVCVRFYFVYSVTRNDWYEGGMFAKRVRVLRFTADGGCKITIIPTRRCFFGSERLSSILRLALLLQLRHINIICQCLCGVVTGERSECCTCFIEVRNYSQLWLSHCHVHKT